MVWSSIMSKSNSKPRPLYRDILREGKLAFFYEHITPAYIWPHWECTAGTKLWDTTWFKQILFLTQKHLNIMLGYENNQEWQASKCMLLCWTELNWTEGSLELVSKKKP